MWVTHGPQSKYLTGPQNQLINSVHGKRKGMENYPDATCYEINNSS